MELLVCFAVLLTVRNQVPGLRPQLPLQHRGPQQIQRAPPPAAAAPRQGSGSANGSLCHNPTNSSRPPPVAALCIPSTSALRPSAASPNLSRAPFSSVNLPTRPGSALRAEQRAPAPHLARARSHISATVLTSTPTSVPGNVALATMEQLQSLLARSQEGPASRSQTQNAPAEYLIASRSQEGSVACGQTQTHNLPVESLAPSLREGAAVLSQTQTQNFPVESMHASFGNSRGSGQIEVGDGVVYLSDDD